MINLAISSCFSGAEPVSTVETALTPAFFCHSSYHTCLPLDIIKLLKVGSKNEQFLGKIDALLGFLNSEEWWVRA